jgi:hypothetical protein
MTKPKSIKPTYEREITAALADLLALQRVETMLPLNTYRAAIKDRLRRLVVVTTSKELTAPAETDRILRDALFNQGPQVINSDA